MGAASELTFAYAIGFMLVLLLYGANVCLFVVAIAIVYRQNRHRSIAVSLKVFYALNATLFLCTTLFTGFTMSQFVKAFFTDPDGPSVFLVSSSARFYWENMVTRVLIVVAMALFNGLMVYRCYVIWLGNIRAVIIQILLEITIIVFSTVSFVSFGRPDLLAPSVIHRIVEVNGPLHLTQNILNTSLIVFRLFWQHRISAEAGLQRFGTSLMQTARIIIESALIYTLLLLCLVIVNQKGNIYAYTLQELIVPVTGIVLNLIVVRGYLLHSSATAETPSKIVLRDLLPTPNGSM